MAENYWWWQINQSRSVDSRRQSRKAVVFVASGGFLVGSGGGLESLSPCLYDEIELNSLFVPVASIPLPVASFSSGQNGRSIANVFLTEPTSPAVSDININLYLSISRKLKPVTSFLKANLSYRLWGGLDNVKRWSFVSTAFLNEPTSSSKRRKHIRRSPENWRPWHHDLRETCRTGGEVVAKANRWSFVSFFGNVSLQKTPLLFSHIYESWRPWSSYNANDDILSSSPQPIGNSAYNHAFHHD